MKNLALAGAVSLGLALGGCSTVQSDITSATNWLASPTTTQALANLKAGATIFVCAVANAQALASELEPALNAGQSITGTGNKVLVVSTALCGVLSGKVAGTTTAVSGMPVAIGASSVATVQ